MAAPAKSKGKGVPQERPKPKKEKIFNDRGRKIFRKIIPTSEVVFGVAFVLITLGMGLWFYAQHDNYDPGERDISMEVLEAQSVEDNLYRTPLEPWIEPGTQTAAFVSGGAPDISPFPAALLSEGWKQDGLIESFTPQNVYEKIDGQEVEYNNYGMVSMNFIALTNPEADLDVSIELYDMGSFVNALGIFGAQRSGGVEVLQDGDTNYYLTEIGGMGLYDKYYFKVVGSDLSPKCVAVAETFVRNFKPEVSDSDSSPVPLLVLTRNLGVSVGGIEFVKEDAFQYAFAKEFWFGAIDGVENAKYYLHDAGSEDAAKELFGKIAEEFAFENTEVSRDAQDAVYKHDFLKTFLSVNYTGQYVFGVEGAPTEDVLAEKLASLRDALTSKLAAAPETQAMAAQNDPN